jgi:hypothetical protein
VLDRINRIVQNFLHLDSIALSKKYSVNSVNSVPNGPFAFRVFALDSAAHIRFALQDFVPTHERRATSQSQIPGIF